MTILIGIAMLSKFMTLLAWAGLWRLKLEVLNADTPAIDNRSTPSHLADFTSTAMNELLHGWVRGDGHEVDYDGLTASTFWASTLPELRARLKATDPAAMNPTQRKTFFINLYNILTIDAILSMEELPSSTISVPQFWRRYGYQVGPHTLHMDDIEHGILRGNRAHPTSGDVMFPEGDPRLALTLPADHRIHAALNCGAKSCPRLASFSVLRLETELDEAMAALCNTGVSVSGDSVAINSIFKWFLSDFASNEDDLLRWLGQCTPDPSKAKALRLAVEDKKQYSFYYDWSLNKV